MCWPEIMQLLLRLMILALGGKGLDPSLPGGMNGTLLKEGYSVMVDIGG